MSGVAKQYKNARMEMEIKNQSLVGECSKLRKESE